MTNTPSLYIGIDLGTSGVRACAINENKELLFTCKTPLPAPLKQGLSITQAPHLWWEATEKVLHELLTHIDANLVQAISVNGTSGTVLVCDEFGVPLAPARMYNDGFCTEQAELIKSIAPSSSAAHGTSSGLAKLVYLQQEYPDATHLLHQADWIVGKLCGRFDISDENNALKTGYDPVNACWPEWLALLNINLALLPKVIAPGKPISNINNNCFGLKPGCQMVSGTTDSIAAFIATGSNKPGDAVTSLGSTLVLKVISDKPINAPEFGIYSHKLGDYWLAGGASNTGGAVLEHYFNQKQIDEFTEQLNSEQPTALNYYPLIQAGERFPVNDPNFPPRLEPKAKSQLEFFQGMLEGISQIELDGYQKLQQLGAPYPSHIETAGGGSKNTAWSEIRELTLGVKVKQAVFSEACYGSALLAMSGININ